MARSRGLPPELARSRWGTPGYRYPTAEERRRIRQSNTDWDIARRSERAYAAQLRALARNIGNLINGFPPDPDVIPTIQRMLDDYASIIGPWARATAERMIEEVMRRDAAAWFRISREIGRNLRYMIDQTPLGSTIRQLLDDQVELISSMPTDAGRDVQRKVQDLVVSGRRYDDLIPDIREAMGDVAHNTVVRATLIGRTETAKAQSSIVQARAQYIGAEQYVWHSVEDHAVRPMHRKLNGTVHRWDDPPIASEPGQKEMRYHPGGGPNCRCFSEPIIPEVIE